MFKTIFVDMDGVLANFESHFERVAGHPAKGFEKQYGKQGFWLEVWKDPDFFFNLNPCLRAHDLVELCKAYTKNVYILTAPSTINQVSCIMQKTDWLKRHAFNLPVIFESSKYKYANPSSLLIDDYGVNCDAFEDNGGTAFKYNAHAGGYSKLKSFLLD